MEIAVTPDAYDVADGLLDLGLLTLEGLLPDADRVARLLDPEDETQGLVDRVRFKKADIETETPFHLNLDGEPLVDTRFEIETKAHALNFALPSRALV